MSLWPQASGTSCKGPCHAVIAAPATMYKQPQAIIASSRSLAGAAAYTMQCVGQHHPCQQWSSPDSFVVRYMCAGACHIFGEHGSIYMHAVVALEGSLAAAGKIGTHCCMKKEALIRPGCCSASALWP